jgi:putative toxin-antitoxin system antitoxin component (TIGR02293 family)
MTLTGLIENFHAAAVAGKPARLRPVDLSKSFAKTLSVDEIGELIVAKRTLARRIAKNEPLSPDETDRAFRVGSVTLTAQRVFANPAKAHAWLRRPNPALTGQRPIDLLRSEAGTQAVNQLLIQIDHGMYI